MNMKKILKVGITSAILLCTVGCSGNIKSKGIMSMKDNDLKEEVYNYFLPLTKIYRETFHEKEVSDYLREWAEGEGYTVTQDSANNIIFDVPATKGLEDKPLTILQVHMDMVLAVEEGYEFNKENDEISVVRDGDTVKGEHTSLGADDGSGIAIIQCILKESTEHGPLRVIITTDEEQDQSGLAAMDTSFAEDAEYLINVDSEASNSITVSSASAITFNAEKIVKSEKRLGDTVLEINVSGGAGGHSGFEISNGKINCLVALCDFIYQIKNAGIDFQIASAKSGTAMNAIPTSATAVIVTDFSNADTITKMASDYAKMLQDTYLDKNSEINCTVSYPNLLVDTVMSESDANALIAYAINTVSGVYTMSQKTDGLIESSSNLGILEADTTKIFFVSCIRSSENAPENHLETAAKCLAESLGFTYKSDKACYAWPIRSNSKLRDIAEEVYLEQNGENPLVESIHAGLETGRFSAMNSNLDMISIGPDITGAHTTEETLNLESTVKIVRLIDGILRKIAE